VRAGIYISAVARCFPGKAPGGGDRRPDPGEIERCSRWLSAEVALLKPHLVIPVGTLAIASVLGHTGKLLEVVGKQHRATFFGHAVDVIPLPHPSGASTWHHMEPGARLLKKALGLLRKHPDVQATFGTRRRGARPAKEKSPRKPASAAAGRDND
jgi:uracil-DNA glycosylase